MDKEKELKETLRAQLKDKAADAELEKTMAALKEGREAIRQEFEKFRGQMDAILTPTQRAKRMLMGMGPMSHRRGKHGG
jgi:Spy/CpxP family protein refolding chaperone